MMTELLIEIFQVCIIPLLGVLTTYLIKYLNAKATELTIKVDSDVADNYINMICDTITNCVIATNQTYVNSLKEQGKFTAEAQKIAFEKTYNAVLQILSDDAKEYLNTITNDAQAFLIQLIEAEVNRNRN